MEDVKVKGWWVVGFAVLRVVRFVRELGRVQREKRSQGLKHVEIQTTRRDPGDYRLVSGS